MCAFKYREINNFCETKINHKDIYMLMHSCCSILFNMLSGFDLNSKGFKNHLEMNLEIDLEKKEKEILSKPLPSSFWPIGPFPRWPSSL